MLVRGVPKENAREVFDHVSFIVFNYDRCLQHFLFHALQKIYGLRDQEAWEIVLDTHIIHPYGSIGELESLGRRGGIPFGGGHGRLSADYIALSEAIKTYTEQITAADLQAQLEAEVHKAECIVFLGFGYHSQNMRLLKPST